MTPNPLMPSPNDHNGRLAITTAPQAAAQALREAIISGELKGGDRVLEQKWSARLGIGQPTLREAMRELEHQGLLRKVQQRGTYVTELDADDYRRILEVRIPLESVAIGKATKNLTPEAMQELEAVVEAMAAGPAADVKGFHDCGVLFHRKIWALAGNEYLQTALETITFRLFVFSIIDRWPSAPNSVNERKASVQQHRAILKGIRTRDPVKAREAFIHNTVRYWTKQYGLEIDERDLHI